MNFILSVRSYCSNTSGPVKKSANLIRNEFLDYFKQDLGHTFIRSSPVVPLNDHTVAFVNAGMNQVSLFFELHCNELLLHLYCNKHINKYCLFFSLREFS